MLPNTPASVLVQFKNELGVLVVPEPGTFLATLFRNGEASAAAVGLAATAVAGEYKATWTNGAWADGDQLQLRLSVTVDTVTYRNIVWSGEIRAAAVPEQLTDILQIVLGRLHN